MIDAPTHAVVSVEGRRHQPLDAAGGQFSDGRTTVSLRAGNDGALDVDVTCPSGPIARVGLRFPLRVASGSQFLGDAWERSYGDLRWRHPGPDSLLPWYFLAREESGRTVGYGVQVRPSAFCAWTVAADTATLWLDLTSGGVPSEPGARTVPAASVVSVDGVDAWSALHALCAAMCPESPPDSPPIVGANNWYYAYGENFSPAEILRDADTIVDLADGREPFCVVDAGWSPGGRCPGGPWTGGIPGRFDDMPGLAAEITARGARPGIWIRPAALTTVADPAVLRSGPRTAEEQPLDLSRADNLEPIAADVARMTAWGYRLIKHDFSTFDHFGRFGLDMNAELDGAAGPGLGLTDAGWSPADRSLTNAEILLRFYRTVRAAAGAAVLIGCNTVGHLAAGLVDIQRIGDDTSGRQWSRTREMGVNTLAFRLPQHRRFFTADADCVPVTPQTSWQRNRQFLDLVARSGTALFVSVDPAARTARTDADIRRAIGIALRGGDGTAAPLDWTTSQTPTRWRFGDNTHTHDWG